MTKSLKRIFVGVFSAMAILVAGLFFSSCGYDISKVSVTADVSSITLELGSMNESQEVKFKINNAPDSFNKTLRFNVDNEGVVELSSPKYSGNEVTVTVTAKAGGSVNIIAVTEEGYRYTTVGVNVIQHSTTLQFDNSSLYLSNSTNFVANNGSYYFDANTTDKNMSFYYVEENLNSATFLNLNNDLLTFNRDGKNFTAEIGDSAFRFDTASINEEESCVVFFFEGNEVARSDGLIPRFNMLAFYDYSTNYAVQLGVINEVNVYSDLEVKFEGGHLLTNENAENVTFSPIENDEILIVPNYSNYDAYILKVNILNYSDLVDFSFSLSQSENVQIDDYSVVENVEGKAYYLKISHLIFDNLVENLTLNVKYKAIDDDVQDDSVNLFKTFKITIMVAPKDILINGRNANGYSSEQNPVTVYNRYRTDFGWNDLQISVSANIDAEPIYTYSYVEMEEGVNNLEFENGGRNISSGDEIDLSSTLRFRGRDAELQSEISFFTINVVCEDILVDGQPYILTVKVFYQIVQGVVNISSNENVGDAGIVYIDYRDTLLDTEIFNNFLYADAYFQDIMFEFVSGDDVVSFVDMQNVCLPSQNEEEFYLNFGVRSKRTGTGIYTVTVDNGVSISVTFRVVETMKEENTSIEISSIGGITYYDRWKSSEDLEYDDILNIEILNPTTRIDNEYVVEYGTTASITFNGNISNIDVENEMFNGVISTPSKLGDRTYQLRTEQNGKASVEFSVVGNVVDTISHTPQPYQLSFTLNIVSYSLLNEFVFLNNGEYAVDNVVYYGDSNYIPENDRQIFFTTRAEPTESYNFYKYSFTDAFIEKFVNNSVEEWDPNGVNGETNNTGDIYTIISSADFETEVVSNLVAENYQSKFIYYFVDSNSVDASPIQTSTVVTLSMSGRERTVNIVFENGFMFYNDNFSTEITYDGRKYTVELKFSNVFTIGEDKNFDLSSMTYTHNSQQGTSFTIHSYVSQREYTQMRYDLSITAVEYIPVTDISTATVIDELAFTKSNLEESFVVYVSPQNATNTNLKPEYIPDNAESTLIEVDNSEDFEIVEEVAGTYSVRVSVERFYNNFDPDEISDISLSGTLYIYPPEWGESASVISGHNPISIKISYRNGSERNRYILETAEDVFKIARNEKTLNSHYELRNAIDLSGYVGGRSIGLESTKEIDGVIQNVLLGFGGSIVGTTSQSGFSGVNLRTAVGEQSNGILPFEMNGVRYYGLFAKIEEGAYIKNISLSGNYSLTTGIDSRIGLLTGSNYGKISNVSVDIMGDSSIIYVQGGNARIGAVVGENYGEILQYFKAYNTQEYVNVASDADFYYSYQDVAGEFGLNNMSVKNMAYFESKLTINVSSNSSAYVGGVAGATFGNITRVDDESLKIYGYSNYSAYVNIEISEGNGNGIVYAGGIAGYAESTPTTGASSPLNIQNLIVGGEVDCQYNDAGNSIYQTAVGGLIGFATIGNKENAVSQNVNIFGNIARVFLRGSNYVGGIVGVDNYGYSLDQSYSGYSRFAGSNSVVYNEMENGKIISTNSVEAVDDGRPANDASMFIIRHGETKIDNEDGFQENVVISIGNALVSNSGYLKANKDTLDFQVKSYVVRTKIESSIYSQGEISRNLYYGDYLVVNGNSIVESKEFQKEAVNIGLSKQTFRLSPVSAGNEYVYLAFHFNVDSLVSSQNSSIVPQDIVDELNSFTPNATLYPFAIDTRDAEILSTSYGYLNVDANGNITTLNEGLAQVRLQSILNVQNSINIYLQIMNFFNINVKESVFYTSNTSDGRNIVDGTNIFVYGNRQTSIYAVATYEYEQKSGNILDEGTENEREEILWSVSKDGVLRYKDMSFKLSPNTSLRIEVESKYGTTMGDYTRAIVNGTQVIFSGTSHLDGADNYYLNAYVESIVGGNSYRMNIGNSEKDTAISVAYRETATAIYTSSEMISMETNQTFSDVLTIESNNPEFAYYEIYMLDENGETISLIQSKMEIPANPGEVGAEAKWLEYINYFTNDDMFILTFAENDSLNKKENEIKYDFYLSVNRDSDRYKNRDYIDIYGLYKIKFYANALKNGVSGEYIFNLTEAKISNVVVDNFSNANDISLTDQIIVPSRDGLLEISVDPIDAEFERFTIKNDQRNYVDGAGVSAFTFAYQTSQNGFVTFTPDSEFGIYRDGNFTFTFKEMMQFFDEVNRNIENESEKVTYRGKIYIIYLMQSNGVEDSMPIRFNISIEYYDKSELMTFDTSIDLTTKLANYAHLSFDDREESDVYYVARGLSYDMTLDYYGFGLDDISISVSDERYASVQGSGVQRVLQIEKTKPSYTGDDGYQIIINVNAHRIVDNAEVTYSQQIVVYIMEYVFNYQYVEGKSEDLVRGMNDGVISTAIGNAYALDFDIWSFMEYDDEDETIVEEVRQFASTLTSSVDFNVVNNMNSTREKLETGKEILTDYYIIRGLTFIAVRLYEPSLDLYYFTVEGQYAMNNGVYICDNSSNYEQHKLHTTFTFSIHQQSTDESPLPVESYEDFINMEEGEYYILLTDIVLPNRDSLDLDQFQPIETNIAGFDGNGYSILLGGDYHFDADVHNIGIFSNIGKSVLANDIVFKNITVELFANTYFSIESTTFSVGLLAASNNSIITNSQTVATNDSKLIVNYVYENQGSYVAGFVGTNNGIITNSSSSVDIETNVNLAGFVASNNGTISSSAFRGGSLLNETNLDTEFTAGFALQNSGRIYTSYVSGEEEDVISPNPVFYNGKKDFIQSDNTISGFVFENEGYVQDCYSNINMEVAGSFSAGFVYQNGVDGEIRTSFSTSMLASYNTQSYGFARANRGYIWDCYYISQKSEEITLENLNGLGRNVSIIVEEDVNVSVSTIDANSNRHNLRALSLKEFTISNGSNFEENFKNYIHTNTRNYNSVWFYNNQNNSTTFNGKVLNLYRLELVAPNITAFSQKYLHSTEEVKDEETGVTTVKYNYLNTDLAGITGSVYNPILLDRAENFENYILNENDRNGYNYSYYRLINNIDYEDFVGNSSLYTTRFMGYLEGNFLEIANMHMVSSQSMLTAGLFAEVGSSTRVNAIGTILNFDFIPEEMVFTNTQVVGGITGRLDDGIIANVNVSPEESMMVSGRNIVGGVVGVAVGNFTLANIQSTLSARATHIATTSNEFDSSSTVYSSYSFAGAVIGVASGTGLLNRIDVSQAVSVVGAKAGAITGFIDKNVTARNLTLTVDEELVINAFNYGGLIAGQSSGTLSDITVEGTEYNLQIFSLLPYTPSAIGGVVGLASGGSITNVSMTQSLNLSKTTSTSGVDYVGGLVGLTNATLSIRNATVEANLVGFRTLGGLIGSVSGDNSVNISDFDYIGELNLYATSISEGYVGGVIAQVDGRASIKVNATLSELAKTELTHHSDKYYKNSVESEESDTSDIIFVDSIDKYSTISSDFATDENGVLIESYRNSANSIDISSDISIFVYDADSVIFFGEIVAQLGLGTVDVANTISRSNVTAGIYDMEATSFVEDSTSLISSPPNEDAGYRYYYEKTFDSENPEYLIGRGFVNNLIYENTSRINLNSYGTAGYDKGNYFADSSFSCVPIYSQNITFTYYKTDLAEIRYRINVNNVGACVDDQFLGIED